MRQRILLVGLIASLGLAAGCEPPVIDGGKDMAYLTDPEAPNDTQSEPLLPLTPGNTWTMDALSVKKRAEDRLKAVGPIALGSEKGTLVEILRDGRIWRREAYRIEKDGTYLLGFGEARQPLLTLNPPLRLFHVPAKVGEYVSWNGTIRVKNSQYRAVGFSRVSTREDLAPAAGRFVAYRIDTVLSILNANKPTHFPTIRWLAPGIGFVKRGYADEGNPALAELKRFSVH